MDIQFRNIVPGDIGWLISQHGSVYADQFGFDQQFEIDISQKMVNFWEKRDGFNRIWIAVENDIRIGSIAVSRMSPDRAFINFLLVDPEYRGRGVGKNLMETLLGHCLNHNIGTIRLETYSILTGARELYRKFGFHCLSEKKNVEKYGLVFTQEFWEKRVMG